MRPAPISSPRLVAPLIAAALAVAALAGAALAQAPAQAPAGAPAEGSAVAKRQAVYKGWAAATREPANMLQGKSPFDLATVQATFKVYGEGARGLKDLFPDDSKPGAANGAGTKALPALWDNRGDFEARLAKFAADSDAAAASVKDEASFKAALPGILGQCGSCHNAYREKT